MTNQVIKDKILKLSLVLNGEELISIGKTASKQHEKKREKGNVRNRNWTESSPNPHLSSHFKYTERNHKPRS